jgi:hypothetical protein
MYMVQTKHQTKMSWNAFMRSEGTDVRQTTVQDN